MPSSTAAEMRSKNPEERRKCMEELNKILAGKSYMDGFCPSDADRCAFLQFQSPPANEFAHLLRWFNHIKSFSPDEQKAFGPASTSFEAVKPKKAAADEDFDLFGDEEDEDDAEKEAVKQQRVAAYQEKKSKKPALVAKSSIVLDIKPWDDQTDLKEIERLVREIKCDGLLWAKEAKFLPVAYGIKKVQIGCVVEDDKVSTDFLEESILAIDELVQSVDIAAFNKI